MEPDLSILDAPIPSSARGDQKTEPEAYSLKTFQLAKGRTSHTLAQTDLFRISMKVYAEGGENAMHAHPYEDHAFTVLKGQATFYLGKEAKVRVVNAYEGILMPRGALYRFESSGSENLVILRVGAEVEQENTALWRVTAQGTAATPDTPERRQVNGYERPEIVPGQFHFG